MRWCRTGSECRKLPSSSRELHLSDEHPICFPSTFVGRKPAHALEGDTPVERRYLSGRALGLSCTSWPVLHWPIDATDDVQLFRIRLPVRRAHRATKQGPQVLSLSLVAKAGKPLPSLTVETRCAARRSLEVGSPGWGDGGVMFHICVIPTVMSRPNPES